MRASFVVMLSKASVFCSLSLSASIDFAQSSSNEVSAEVFPLVTNLTQLREVSSSEPNALYDVRLEGDVWWASATQRKLIFKDASGAEELELELNSPWPHAGERVRLQGKGTIVQKGAGFRVGQKNPLVDSDGANGSVRKSGTTYLLAGRYPFRLEWFNATEKPGLDVSCEGPGLPRKRLSSAVLWRADPTPDGASTNFVPGLNYQCYEGEWESMPDFNSLKPVKTGTSAGPDGKLRTCPNNSGLVFTGFFEAAKSGVYTFYLKSSDGSRLFLGQPTLHAQVLGLAAVPQSRPLRPGQSLEETESGCWSEMEGQVTSVQRFPDGIRLELRNGSRSVLAQIGEPSDFPFPLLLKCWIRAKGFAEAAFTPDGQRVVGCLLVPGSKEIMRLDAPVQAGITNIVGANGALEIPRSTRVRVQGILASLKQTVDSQVLEIQAGTRRFLARLYDSKISLKNLRVGSRLELVGVYCAQGGYSALGTDVVPLDLLLGSPPEIRVLAPPPWWTLQRLLVLAGTLACLLALMALWVTQLRSQVEQRSAELAVQIQTRERAEQQRAMEQERARIAQDLHDELGSDITEIGMLAARAKSISSTEQERTGYLGQMTQKARQMVDALEEIVWAMNPTHDSLESLVSYFRFFAERFLGLANIAWQFDDSIGSQRYSVDSRRRHELFLAFKEALTNIVRHSGATRVRLSLEVAGTELRLTIADDGRGFSVAEHNKSMDGISNMRARIEKLGGRFELQSEGGQGTTLRFFVPLT